MELTLSDDEEEEEVQEEVQEEPRFSEKELAENQELLELLEEGEADDGDIDVLIKVAQHYLHPKKN